MKQKIFLFLSLIFAVLCGFIVQVWQAAREKIVNEVEKYVCGEIIIGRDENIPGAVICSRILVVRAFNTTKLNYKL
jgi:hypothetical protein